MKLIHHFWNCLDTVLDGFSSRLCYGCKKAYSEKANKFYCEECFNQLELSYEDSVKNLAFKLTELEEFFGGDVIHYPRVHFVSEYGELTKSLMREFKYRKPHFKKFWLSLIESFLSENKNYIFSGLEPEQIKLYDLESLDETELKLYLAAVPMHKSQLKKRGFNQADLLAQGLEEKLASSGGFIYQTSEGLKKITRVNLEYLPDLFFRVKDTEKLFDKNRIERLEILKESFSLNMDIKLEQDSLLLLIDDITTTGASFMSIYKTLLSLDTKPDMIFLASCGKN